MAKRKRVFCRFSYEEADNLAKYLEYMASIGWHFVKWGVFIEFEQGEPSTEEYDVVVFSKGGQNDTRPNKDAEEFSEYCKMAGWELVDGIGKFCIFKKTKEDATPILTDEEKLESIYSNSMKAHLISFIAFGFISFLYILNIASYPISILIGPNAIATLFFLIFALYHLCMICNAKVKYKKYMHQLKEYGQKPFWGRRKKHGVGLSNYLYLLFLLFIISVYFLYYAISYSLDYFLYFMVPTVVVLIIFNYFLLHKKFSSRKNFVIRIGFIFAFYVIFMVGIVFYEIGTHNDSANAKSITPVFNVSDFCDETGELLDQDSTYETSIFSHNYSHDFDYENGYFRYTVYESRFQFALDIAFDHEIDMADSTTDITSKWNCQRAYYDKFSDDYYVKFDDKVLYFSCGQKLTDKQISIIEKTLGE